MAEDKNKNSASRRVGRILLITGVVVVVGVIVFAIRYNAMHPEGPSFLERLHELVTTGK